MNNSYFKTIIYSFYSAKPYMPALQNWRGRGFMYLLLVTTILSLLTTAGWMRNVNNIKTKDVADALMGRLIPRADLTFEENINRYINILSQVPAIQIENGKVKTPSAEVYSISDPLSGRDLAIIDTTGKIKSLEGTDAQVLLTDTKLITRSGKKREAVDYIPDIVRNYSIDEKTFNDALFTFTQIPQFTLHNGKFSTKDDKLYKIYDRKNIEIAQIGYGAELGMRLAPILAISSTEISYKNIFTNKSVVINAADFNEAMLFDIIQNCLGYLKKLVLWGIPLLALPFVILTSFVFNLIMLLFYTFIGHSFIKMKKLGQFEYKDLTRVSAIAITPMLTASALLPQLIPSQGIIYFLIAMGYLYYAIMAVTTPK